MEIPVLIPKLLTISLAFSEMVLVMLAPIASHTSIVISSEYSEFDLLLDLIYLKLSLFTPPPRETILLHSSLMIEMISFSFFSS
jgi:hypothetical protein